MGRVMGEWGIDVGPADRRLLCSGVSLGSRGLGAQLAAASQVNFVGTELLQSHADPEAVHQPPV